MSDLSRIAESSRGQNAAVVSLGYGYWQWRRYAFFAAFFGYPFYYGEPKKPGAGTAA